MAEALKDGFGADVPVRIAAMLCSVDPDFDADTFVREATDGLAGLELMPRARQISDALARTLPTDRARAIRLITASLPDLATVRSWRGMQGFVLMPYVRFVADHGLDCFEASMTAQYEITKRFTVEFSIRVFIDHRYEETMARLQLWALDSDEHVRRLVSEGTRPRLPWAPRLRRFQRDPAPVLELLELLRDDPSEYVRRSVANNLNDIAKDHPDVVLDVTRRWWHDGHGNRRKLVRHALRTLVKQGDPEALAIMGYVPSSAAGLAGATIVPGIVRIGDRVRIEVTLGNPSGTAAPALVDLEIRFPKPGGATTVKVFKGAELSLAPGETAVVRRSVSLAPLTTRRHHPGRHDVAVLLNGGRIPIGSFEVVPGAASS